MIVLAETVRSYPGGLEALAESLSADAAYQTMERLFPGVDAGQLAGGVRESLSALFSGSFRSVSPEEVVVTVTSGLGALTEDVWVLRCIHSSTVVVVVKGILPGAFPEQ